MGVLENIGGNIVAWVTTSLRRFTAFLFILFAAGIAYGSLIIQQNPGMLPFAIGVSVLLAILAYFSTAFAVIVFILLAVVLLLL